MPDDTRIYQMTALSPVHIGSGNRLSLEDYDLQDRDLIRFDANAVLRAMAVSLRNQVEEHFMAGKFPPALDLIRSTFRQAQQQCKNVGRPCPLELYRVRLCEASRQQLSEAIRNPNRSGEIHSLLRNPYHHAVIVPGSAIKGAIRTALLSYFANLVDNSGLRSEVNLEKSHNRSYGREPNLNRAADLLERRILGPESDSVSAMQMLKVSDAEWSPQHVLISKASLEKLSRSSDQTGSMQIHFERLRCQADGAGQPPSCEITIRLNGDALRHPKVPLHRKLDWTTIADACNQFFAGRYNAEQTRFLTILKRSFPHENFPWRPDLRPGDILLRVGHHCHFDSLSVDELREGWNAHTKSPLRDIGNTRTLCELETTGSAPFGWTLLRRIS